MGSLEVDKVGNRRDQVEVKNTERNEWNWEAFWGWGGNLVWWTVSGIYESNSKKDS